jgi:hypothetical protein
MVHASIEVAAWDASHILNFAIVAHIDQRKYTLVDRVLVCRIKLCHCYECYWAYRGRSIVEGRTGVPVGLFAGIDHRNLRGQL